MCGDSHGIPATAAPSPDSGRGGKWSAAEVTLVSCVTRHASRVSRAGVDHVEGDPVPDAGEAVPQELDEDGGDGELHVGHKQRHGDGACPPALRGGQHFNFQHSKNISVLHKFASNVDMLTTVPCWPSAQSSASCPRWRGSRYTPPAHRPGEPRVPATCHVSPAGSAPTTRPPPRRSGVSGRGATCPARPWRGPASAPAGSAARGGDRLQYLVT